MNAYDIWQRESDPDKLVQINALVKTDPVQAFKQYLGLAEQGSVWSMQWVGWAFETGTGTAQDSTQAEKWYRRSFEAGSDEGLLQLGRLYIKSGQYAKAEEIYRTGVERHWVPAMLRLAWIYSKAADWPAKREMTLKLLQRASGEGDLGAKDFLAQKMIRGWFGWSRIPSGVRLLYQVANDFGELLKEDERFIGKSSKKPLGFFGRFVQGFSVSLMRVSDVAPPSKS
jgi:TPR repeat protein